MGSSFLEAKNLDSPATNTPSEQGLDLLKILSHDLRGSLVSMSAVLHILNRGCHEKAEDLIETKLAELIDRIGNLSSMLEESLQMVLALEEGDRKEHSLIDFKRDVIEPVFSEFASEIKDRQLIIENPLDTITSFFIPAKTNKTILKMIFRNLFGNAVKYAELGGIIAISIKHGSPFCLLKIYNSGRPIAEGLREKLFSKHLPPQVREEKNRHGMGLGLHLAKRIMQTQGGEIWYEPEDQGTSFVIAIPVETWHKRYTSYVQGTLFS
jgi:signal transduction histidine kinase